MRSSRLPRTEAGRADRLDVFCVGHASYDLVFAVPHHPGPDEKMFADQFIGCGGGPAANAAVIAARLGYQAGFCGFLGNDLYGQMHYAELEGEGVDTRWVVRGHSATPVSAVLVKPDGARALVSYKGETGILSPDDVDFTAVSAAVLLFDGHEPRISGALADRDVPKVLDAGSLHAGTESLMFRVDYLVASEKFARQWLGEDDPERALRMLAERSPAVVITLGERGLIWMRSGEMGRIAAFEVDPVDTTGAGDAFHGAFAAALAAGMEWTEVLRFASAAGAACCTVMGARPGLPDRTHVERLLGH